MSSCSTLNSLRAAKARILEAIEKGATIVKEIEIRGRIVKHNDLLEEYEKICNLIKIEESVALGTTRFRPARNQGILRRG